jgi:hypothetical protein
MVDFARHQRRCLDGARQLNQLDVESMFLENAGVFGDEESQKGQTKGGMPILTFLDSWAVAQINQEKMSDEQPIRVNQAISLSLIVFPSEPASITRRMRQINKPFSNEVTSGRDVR